MDLPPDDREEVFIRRVARTAWGLVIVGAAGELILRKSVAGAASLTGAGAVAIINFRWLEAVLRRVVQPEDVGVPEAATRRRMDVHLGVSVFVVPAMVSSPPEGIHLSGRRTCQCQHELKDTARLEAAMGEVTVVARRQGKHVEEVRRGRCC